MVRLWVGIYRGISDIGAVGTDVVGRDDVIFISEISNVCIVHIVSRCDMIIAFTSFKLLNRSEKF